MSGKSWYLVTIRISYTGEERDLFDHELVVYVLAEDWNNAYRIATKYCRNVIAEYDDKNNWHDIIDTIKETKKPIIIE